MKFRLGQGLHKNAIFGYVYGCVVILHAHQLLEIMGCSQCNRAHNLVVVSQGFMKFRQVDRENSAFEFLRLIMACMVAPVVDLRWTKFREKVRFLRG